MAEKEVVRQDIVQIDFEVKENPLNDLIKSMNEMAKAAKKMQGAVDGLAEVKKKADKSKGSLGKMADTASKIKSKLQPALNKIDDGLKKIGTSAINAGKKIASGIGKTAVKAFKLAAAGVAGFGALAGLSVKNYAEFEQLVGGVETLFGKHSKSVIKNANNAYKTAGLSANAYMETVTSFSASLLQSVGGDTKIAASIADRAIIDMSDNANKMGTDMSMIQNAYQGFAKQNYTMLDNLKLGYGGTKEEMKRLLKDAEKISGQKFDLSSYADIIQAIHVVQTEMGITGTTAKEASSTIQGSISAMKSAWTNFLTGMADPNQDFDMLVGNLVDSVVTVAKNLIPRIKVIIPRLGQGLLEIGKALGPYIVPALKSIGTKAIEYAPIVGAKLKEMLLKAKDFLVQNKGVIWEGFKTVLAQGIATIAQLFTGEQMNIDGIKTKIQEITDKAVGFVNSIKENWPTIKTVIMTVVGAVLALKTVMFACNAIIAANNAVMAVKKAYDIAVAAKTWLVTAAQWAFNTSIMGCPVFWIIAAIVALIAIIVLLVKNWDKVKAAGEKCWEAIKEAWGKACDWLDTKVLQPIKDAFQGAWDFVTDLWGGITDFFSGLWDGIKNIVSKITGKAKEAKGDADTVKATKHAKGGLITKPHLGLVGEAGPEMIIPLKDRKRGLALWEKTGKMLGAQRSPSYTPSMTTSNVSSTTNESNVFSPSFTLNFTGTTDRTAERIIKQWVKEALNDTFDSMGRTSPRLTEV